MPSVIQNKIAKLFERFGKETADDLKESLDQALKQAGRKGIQAPKLVFNELISTTPDGDVILDIQAANGKKGVKYWRYIEEGRKKGARRVPADALGKEWQVSSGITDPGEILLQIQAKRKKRLGITARKTTLSKPPTKLNYTKAVKAYAFMTQRLIYRNGIKKKPYIDRVLDDGRITKLREDLTPLLGERFKLIIKGLE